MKNLILLGGNIEAVPIIQRVRELGFRAVVVDGSPNAPGRSVADDFIEASCYDSDAVMMGLVHAHMCDVTISQEKGKPIHYDARGLPDGVLCAAVDAPVACAEVAAAFGLPGLSVEAAKLSQDKFDQKSRLHNAGIPVPWFGVIPRSWVESTHGTAVIKPVDSRGGRGVIRLLPGIDPAWAYEQAQSASPTGIIMVEEWLDGPQLSTESIIQGGRVLFTAVGLRNYARLDEFAPYVIEDGFDEPVGDDEMIVMIDDIVERSCRALGWYQTGTGTVKGDLVIHDGRIYVIELAARLSGGFFASHGHPLAYGVDFVGAAIKAALGYTLDEPKPYARGFVSQRYVFSSQYDIDKTVTEFKPVAITGEHGQIPVFTTWNIKAGDVIKPVTSHPARWGQALATGRTPDEARQRAEAAVVAMKAGVVV